MIHYLLFRVFVLIIVLTIVLIGHSKPWQIVSLTIIHYETVFSLEVMNC